MTPLFSVPDEGDPVPVPGRGRPASRDRRPAMRGPAGPRNARSGDSRSAASAESRSAASAEPRAAGNRAKRDGLEAPDLLAVTGQRLRRALARSFLRYDVPGDPEVAVHAAMNVVEPVLQARDTEILRLRRLMPPKRSTR